MANKEYESDKFIKTGGTAAQFLKADGSVDSTAYGTAYVHPTHPGDDLSIDTNPMTGPTIISDLDVNVTTDTLGHVTDANATVATRTLTLGDLGFTGNADATIAGSGVKNYVAYFDSTSAIAGEAGFEYSSTTNTLTVDNIIADKYTNVPFVINSNFLHSTNAALTWYNMPFNSVSESSTAGEQHCFIAPAAGRVRTIVMRNTSTGTTPTATNNQCRVIKNGSTLYTTTNSVIGGGAFGMYSAFGLNDTQATFTTADVIRIQFQANGLWYDVAVTVLFELT
jgi:hypothetical protein